MRLSGKSITIIGGGIAGLAAARALALRGASVQVHEAAPQIAEVGAGLQLSPNGMVVLQALGLGHAIRDVSLATQAVILRDYRRGAEVVRLGLSDRAGFHLIHRARLIEVLLAGAKDAGARIITGSRLGPDSAAGDLVVGADGLHSSVRSALGPAPKARFTGQVAWRAVIDARGDADPVAEVFMAPGRHIVSYPLAGGLRNIVAIEERAAWAEEGWTHEGTPAELRAAFEGFGGPVPTWLGAVGKVHVWGLHRHEVAQHWHDDRRVLLGDAAHPTLPFLAQGANMALEDAWVLARCLDADDQAQALARYQGLRRDRTARIVAAANDNARNYHLRGPARLGAHLALRLAGTLAPGALMKRYEWLYGHDVTAKT
ncbi:MAG: NAD(P)-binding protein [Rhodobacteraceae bacterium]|nr:NAD(P)-binding protein [Paracoccaceae bacterium]